MNRLFLAIMAALLVLTAEAAAQTKRTTKSRPGQKQLIAAPAKTPTSPAEYEISALVAKGMGVIIMGISPAHGVDVSNEKAFRGFFKDLYIVDDLASEKKRSFPKVVIKFGDDDDIQTLVNAIKFVAVSSNTTVELENLTERTRLFVVPEPNENEQQIDVKPNPLTLVVAMDEKGNLALNDEEMGKISDLTKLSERLREIYRERETNGVFRENSNEIEKTISIKMPLTGSAGDLSRIAKALRMVGADRIGFELGDPFVTRRDLILDLPIGPPPRKKPTK
jgi:hypothetical protein